MNKVWQFLNDNKTVFGILLSVVVAKYMPSDFLYDVCTYLGNSLAGVGAVHKLAKSYNKVKSKSKGE